MTTSVSGAGHDPGWEQFLRDVPGGHYMQSGSWAEFKRPFGWMPMRVVSVRGRDVVGGAQILLRRLPGLGAIAWAPKAPVFAAVDARLTEELLDGVRRLVDRHRVRVLMIQPPPEPHGLPELLCAAGHRASPVVMAPRTTILLDLERGLDELEAGLRSKTRQHLRKGRRAGVAVREGDTRDLDVFYRLHVAAGERQRFSPYPRRHFTELWRAFRPSGGARLFLAEYEGETVAGLLVLVHGDTVATHAMAWSGRHPRAMPNEVLLWSAIEWSKRRDYRCFDFTWIDPRAGNAIVAGDPLPADLRNSVAFFKLGFGGTVTLLPGAFDYVPHPVLRMALHTAVPAVYRLKSVRAAQHRLRWRWPGSETQPRRAFAPQPPTAA